MMFLLSGCVAPQKVLDSVKPEPVLSSEQFYNELHLHEQRLVQTITGIYQNQEHQYEKLTRMDADLAALLAQVKTLNDRSQRVPRSEVKPKKALQLTAPSLAEKKLLLGELELVYIDEFAHLFTAHVDPAIDSSMLKVDNLGLFERDGDEWVRFNLFLKGDDQSENKTDKTFEVKVKRMIRIKSRTNGKQPVRYPVIRVHLNVGKYQGVTDVYLIMKNKRKHTLVLGRKFIKDIAVIDISQTFIQGKTRLHNSK